MRGECRKLVHEVIDFLAQTNQRSKPKAFSVSAFLNAEHMTQLTNYNVIRA